ncbi:MAG TPA: hypothetical protein VIK75_01960 [Calditerricola sp.]
MAIVGELDETVKEVFNTASPRFDPLEDGRRQETLFNAYATCA